MLSLIEQIVNFVFQEPVLSLLAGGYLFITFGDIKERNLYFERTWKILIAPNQINEYSQAPSAISSIGGFLEKILLKKYVDNALDHLWKNVTAFLSINWKKATGWLFLDAMLLGFLIADLITIQEISALLGFPIELEILEGFDYGFAITMGTFFSIITSGFVLFEISTNKTSDFSDYSSDFYDIFRKWMKSLALFTIISSVLVILFFGLRAFSTAYVLADDWANIINGAAQLSGNVLVRVNTFIVTLLIFSEAFKGFQSIYFVLVLASVIFLGLAYLLTEILVKLICLLLDLLYKLFLWIIWTLSFWIAKPLDKLTFPIRYLFEKFFGGQPSTPE